MAAAKADQGDRSKPILLWLRRDLRLGDHPALWAAEQTGAPVIPVYIFDSVDDALLGAAPRWRLAKALAALADQIAGLGGRLILRRGDALAVLRDLAAESGARAVFWSRYYAAEAIERDKTVKSGLSEDGLEVRSFEGFLLREPWRTQTQTGGYYKVYTPFQKSFSADFAPEDPAPAPGLWPAPESWPDSLALEDLALEAPMRRGAAVLERYASAGEAAAQARLEAFLDGPIAAYHEDRDRLDRQGTSRLSEHLTFGEISPRRAWLAASRVAAENPSAEAGAQVFLKELVWREFAWHLAYHTPHIRHRNWREEWDAFPWRDKAAAGGAFEDWTRGRTGAPMIDAAMRELYVTGYMHNRARMLVASYLTKNLLVDWRLGERWFADCLVDFDPASNAMGWQWAAGSGPDAAPFFRIFNPETQAEKFDPEERYRRRWLPEVCGRGALDLGDGADPPDGLLFYEACPRSWSLSADDPPPTPRISLKEGRARALDAYESLKNS